MEPVSSKDFRLEMTIGQAPDTATMKIRGFALDGVGDGELGRRSSGFQFHRAVRLAFGLELGLVLMPQPADSESTTHKSTGVLLLRQRFQFGQYGREIFRNCRMNMHCTLYDRIWSLRVHDIQQNMNYFISSGPKNRC